MALCVNDLSEVLTELFPARTKWYNIGLKLAVPVETLESIKSKNREEPGDCLREMLLRALRSSTPELTWKRIIEVLSSAVVGQEQLAKSLEEKYAQKGTQSMMLKPLTPTCFFNNYNRQHKERSCNTWTRQLDLWFSIRAYMLVLVAASTFK